MTEHEEQAAVITWTDAHILELPCLDWLYAIPNGIPLPGNAKTRARIINHMKAEGMKPGVPDLFLPFPAREYHGMFIEMKKDASGKPSEGQVEFIDYANSVGYHCEVCGGRQAAIDALKWYLDFECNCPHCQML